MYAHCDIPCGIYDPHLAQVGALTVIRMMDLIADARGDAHAVSRLAKVKEEHAELVKHEIRIIWGDYIKEEHLVKHGKLHELVHNIMQLSSKARQSTDRKVAEELLAKVNQFAEIFWETKGVKTKRAASPYEPRAEVVYPILTND